MWVNHQICIIATGVWQLGFCPFKVDWLAAEQA